MVAEDCQIIFEETKYWSGIDIFNY